MQSKISRKEPWIAGILSLFLAGAGHIYCGKVGLGIVFIVIDLILYYITQGIGALIFGVIIMISSIQLAKDINETLEQEEIGIAKEKEKKSTEDQKRKMDQEINVATFIENLKNFNKLFKNEIYSEKEFINEKKSVINELLSKTLPCSSEDFLTELIAMKEQKILTTDEINKIKKIIL